jgi:hypothetical protein
LKAEQPASTFSTAQLGDDILVAGFIGTPVGDHDADVVRINGRNPERSLPERWPPSGVTRITDGWRRRRALVGTAPSEIDC